MIREGDSGMSLSELFFGARIAEAAADKIKGRGKVVDTNIQNGKKTGKRDEKVRNQESLDEVFQYIEKEMNEYVLDQEEYIKGLCLAFKRPLVSGTDKSYRNMIFVFGKEGTGRKYSIKVLAKLLAIKRITKESTIYYLDFSQYSTDDSVDKLLLPDLYKAFYGKSPILLIENYEQACAKARDYITNLGTNGVLKLNKRFAWKNGTLTESTNSLDVNTTDSISANNKYIVLVSKKQPDLLNRLFSKRFSDQITDVLLTEDLSQRAYYEIANSEFEDCNNELNQRNAYSIIYEDVSKDFVDELDLQHGANDIIKAVHSLVYEPIIELGLRDQIRRGEMIYLSIQRHKLYGNEFLLGSFQTSDNTAEIEKLDRELAKIIGLDNVKAFIEKLRKHIEFEKQNKKSGSDLSLHMIFCGNPGTGKTTIARLIAQYLKALGCLSSGHLVEVTRADLVGQYLGQTAPKTAEKIRSALGGVLFIDEAYSLSRNKEDFFGVEAIDTIVKYMEDYRGDLVVILAGYTKEMNEFLDVNSGLKSRFNYVIEFPDYSPEELLQISTVTAAKNNYTIDPKSNKALLKYFASAQKSVKKDAGNGRMVRNVIEKAIINHAQRIVDANEPSHAGVNNYLLTIEDFKLEQDDQPDINALDEELRKIIGLESVKKFVIGLKKHIEFEKHSGIATNMSLHMIFCGNPGTGKTTIARLVAKYFKALGVLSSGQLIEVSRADLVAGYVGQTAAKTNSVLQSALGGILFVDEAYSLVHDNQDTFGLEAVDTLVKGMEDHRDDLVVILAGYTKEMSSFMNANSGLRSRFNYKVEFPDYTAAELVQITDVMADSKKYSIAPDCRNALLSYYSRMQTGSKKDAGNGRLVRNTIEKAIFAHSQRLASRGFENINQNEIYLLTMEDFGLKKESKPDFNLESELAPIIGLETVKEFVRSLYATLRVNKARAEMGIPVDDSQTLHMIFTGNPGTGKTTMARIVAHILYEMGVLPDNKLVETDRASLVAGYVGQTAEKTLSVLEQARGGVLFVDEAYSLASGGANDFGREAIDTMVKFMEDNRSEIVVILAGYTDDMQRFLNMNPGLTSRFPTIIEFPNYSCNELLQIIQGMYRTKQFNLGLGTAEKLEEIFEEAKNDPQFGNGRFARNLCEKSIRNLSLRVTKEGVFTKEALTTIMPEDVML